MWELRRVASVESSSAGRWQLAFSHLLFASFSQANRAHTTAHTTKLEIQKHEIFSRVTSTTCHLKLNLKIDLQPDHRHHDQRVMMSMQHARHARHAGHCRTWIITASIASIALSLLYQTPKTSFSAPSQTPQVSSCLVWHPFLRPQSEPKHRKLANGQRFPKRTLPFLGTREMSWNLMSPNFIQLGPIFARRCVRRRKLRAFFFACSTRVLDCHVRPRPVISAGQIDSWAASYLKIPWASPVALAWSASWSTI